MTIASQFHRRLQIVLMALLLAALGAAGVWWWVYARHLPPPVAPEEALAPVAELPPPVEDPWPKVNDAIRAAAGPAMRLDDVSRMEERVVIHGTVFAESEAQAFPKVQNFFERLQDLELLEALQLETFQVRQVGGVLAAQFELSSGLRATAGAAAPRADDHAAFDLVQRLVNMGRNQEIAVSEAIPMTVDRAMLMVRLRLAASPEEVSRYLTYLGRAAANCTGLAGAPAGDASLVAGAPADGLTTVDITCKLS